MQVEKRGLKAESFEGRTGDVCKFAFDVAGVETGVAHDLYALWGNMRDEARNEIESRAGDSDALSGVSVCVEVGDHLTIVTDYVGGSQGRVTEVTPDVFCGIKAFGIEAIGVDLVAAMVTIPLPNGLPQLVVVGASLSKVFAEQIAPFGGQAGGRQVVDFDPRTIFQTAFGHY